MGIKRNPPTANRGAAKLKSGTQAAVRLSVQRVLPGLGEGFIPVTVGRDAFDGRGSRRTLDVKEGERAPIVARPFYDLEGVQATGGKPGPRPLLNLKASFRVLDQTVVQQLPIREVAGVPVEKAELRKFEGARNTFLDPSALTTVHLSFGRLSRDQFNVLDAEFGARSHVKYAPDRSYTAVDFLPPALQALSNQDFEVPDSIRLEGSTVLEKANPTLLMRGEDKDVNLSVNCHATAYEAIRAYQGHQGDVRIFTGDPMAMDLLSNSPAFEKLFDVPRDQLDTLGALKLSTTGSFRSSRLARSTW